MIEDVQKRVSEYLAWLKDRTSLREVADWVEITTPYLDRNNDHLQIYAQRQGDKYVLTDDGHTIDDLALSGCRIDTPKRKDILTTTLNGFGVEITDAGALQVAATAENFGARKHNLLQAILAVNDLFYLASTTVANLFKEDVISWMDANGVRYLPNVKFTGRSGYDHVFDFGIPRSPKYPERILQTITNPTKDTALLTCLAWSETKDQRPPNSKAYAILNDSDRKVGQPILEAFTNYAVNPVLWSRREEVREELVQ